MPNGAITYQGLIEDAKNVLYDSSETPRIDAEFLMQHVAGQALSWLIAYGDTIASAEHVKQFYQLIDARKNGQPIAYLIGQRDFWTLSLDVDENVLIPRPDTETLIEAALECVNNNAETSILDLGTGSGAIALTLAKECSQANVIAIDYHANALAIAKRNAQKNKVLNTTFIQSDWFSLLDSNLRFDLIASNPPYIEPDDPHLTQGDLRFEPSSALVAQENGLADLILIIQTAPNFLKDNAWLIVEHGYNQAHAVNELFNDNGFKNISLHNDLNDLPRCTRGQLAND